MVYVLSVFDIVVLTFCRLFKYHGFVDCLGSIGWTKIHLVNVQSFLGQLEILVQDNCWLDILQHSFTHLHKIHNQSLTTIYNIMHNLTLIILIQYQICPHTAAPEMTK